MGNILPSGLFDRNDCLANQLRSIRDSWLLVNPILLQLGLKQTKILSKYRVLILWIINHLHATGSIAPRSYIIKTFFCISLL